MQLKNATKNSYHKSLDTNVKSTTLQPSHGGSNLLLLCMYLTYLKMSITVTDSWGFAPRSM